MTYGWLEMVVIQRDWPRREGMCKIQEQQITREAERDSKENEETEREWIGWRMSLI